MSEAFTVPTAGLIENLGPGCFVQIRDNDNLLWVEIDAVYDSEFKGRLHPKLNQGYCPFEEENEVLFCKEQITLLGCDRYCFC